jgi:hypothetical protein
MPEPIQVPRFRDAYDRLIEEIRKVPDDDLIVINIDVPTAVTTVLGTLPEIRSLRSQIVSDIPSFDIARFDQLESYTLALGHAHALYLAASAPPESLDELSQTASSLRELLLSDATALAQRGFVDGQKLKELKGPKGYRNVAFDLFTLVALLRESWDKISGKTAVQAAELDQAETLADRMLTAVGAREQAPAVAAETADNRQRAFSLFVDSYDHARRALSFLRWKHEDIDQIAPSLYAGRGNTRRKVAPQPPAATPTNPAATSTATVTAPGGASIPGTAPQARDAAPAAVGLPDSHPYASQ